jgi:hypothetical protein
MLIITKKKGKTMKKIVYSLMLLIPFGVPQIKSGNNPNLGQFQNTKIYKDIQKALTQADKFNFDKAIKDIEKISPKDVSSEVFNLVDHNISKLNKEIEDNFYFVGPIANNPKVGIDIIENDVENEKIVNFVKKNQSQLISLIKDINFEKIAKDVRDHLFTLESNLKIAHDKDRKKEVIVNALKNALNEDNVRQMKAFLENNKDSVNKFLKDLMKLDLKDLSL